MANFTLMCSLPAACLGSYCFYNTPPVLLRLSLQLLPSLSINKEILPPGSVLYWHLFSELLFHLYQPYQPPHLTLDYVPVSTTLESQRAGPTTHNKRSWKSRIFVRTKGWLTLGIQDIPSTDKLFKEKPCFIHLSNKQCQSPWYMPSSMADTNM